MRRIYILYIATISILSLIYISNTYALDYSSNVGIGFTFNPTLSISLSSDDLVIPNLIPGNTLDSNSINVSVATNASYGYTLFANVGDDIHNNSNLTHTNNTDVFSSIATNADLASLETDNTWGYTSKLSNEAVWNNYNGLSSFSNTILLDNNNTADSTGSVDFKISAKAGNTQPSGEYTGTINFIAVTKVAPMSLLDSFIASGAEQLNGYFKMQDMTHDICESVDVEESELQLIDVRDNKVYWVAKLKDGNCWMTQNLDLDLSSTVALTSETSDIDPESYGTTIYTAETGYSKDKNTGIVSWLPSTIDSEGIQRADTIDMVWNENSATVPGWSNDNYKPYSADAGDRYSYNSNSSANDIQYNSLFKCNNARIEYERDCSHYSVGNHYNWSAMIASNDTSSYFGNIVNSICAKGWRLPSTENSTLDGNEFGRLLLVQSIIDYYSPIASYIENGFNAVRAAPIYLVRADYIDKNSFKSSGGSGYYWSDRNYSNSSTLVLEINRNNIRPGHPYSKSYGFSARCLAR